MASGRGFGRAWALASVGGFVDAVGFLTLFGLFTAHQSGNTTHGAVVLGLGHWSDALSRLVPVVTFVAAVVLGMFVAQRRHRTDEAADAARPVLVIELVLLVVLLIVGLAVVDSEDLTSGSWSFYGLAILATAAMGLQASALRHIGDLRVATAFITGMLVSVAEDTAAGWRSKREGRPLDAADSARRVRLHGGIWLTYIAGGILGAFLEARLELWALVLPIAVLAMLLGRPRRALSSWRVAPPGARPRRSS